MKAIQKLILPVLIIAFIALVYFFYFKSDDQLGLFSELDPNNSAVKEVKVKVLHDREISQTSFYAADRSGSVVIVQADQLPPGIQTTEIVIIQGHLSSKESFHAHAVLLEE